MIKEFLNNWDKLMTIVFAGLSALFAGLSFLVIFLDYRRNKANVRVKMNRALVLFAPEVVQFANCSIVNKGRRPIKITGFIFELVDRKIIFLNLNDRTLFPLGQPHFPTILNEMDHIDFSIRLSDLIEALKNTPSKVKYLCFKDTAENVYKYRIKKKYWKELF